MNTTLYPAVDFHWDLIVYVIYAPKIYKEQIENNEIEKRGRSSKWTVQFNKDGPNLWLISEIERSDLRTRANGVAQNCKMPFTKNIEIKTVYFPYIKLVLSSAV